MPILEREFGQLYFRVKGRGETAVVLLHDFFGTHRNWAAVQNQLARYFLVVAPDLRGHGNSRLEQGELSIGGKSEDVSAILNNLGVRKAHLVGLSHGAVIALHLARTDPDLVSSIVVTSVPDINDPAVVAYGMHYAEAIFPTLEESLQQIHGADDPRYVRQTLLASFRDSLQRPPQDHRDAVGKAAEIKCPALVLGSDGDPVLSPEGALRLARSLPNAHLAILPATGHLAHLESPVLYTEVLLDHILRCERAQQTSGQSKDPYSGS
jgi:pimeloyl-ACP methyl ester carboxylesterase